MPAGPKEPLYAFSPLDLIPPLLEQVRQEQLPVILVAPDRCLWYTEMTHIWADQSSTGPQFMGALFQETGFLLILIQAVRDWFLRGTGLVKQLFLL